MADAIIFELHQRIDELRDIVSEHEVRLTVNSNRLDRHGADIKDLETTRATIKELNSTMEIFSAQLARLTDRLEPLTKEWRWLMRIVFGAVVLALLGLVLHH
jgi:predicted  nucleic acid-binding Zn-ribbon protein